jgi:hypothetical protein
MFYEASYDYEFFNNFDFLMKAILYNKFYIAGFLYNIVKIGIPLETDTFYNYIIRVFKTYANIYNEKDKHELIDHLIENDMNIEIKDIIDEFFDEDHMCYFIEKLIDNDNIEILEFIYSNNYIIKNSEFINYAIYRRNIYCAKFLKDIYKLEYNKEEILKDFNDITEDRLNYHILLFEEFCKLKTS